MLLIASTAFYGCSVIIDYQLRKRTLAGTIFNRLLGGIPLFLLMFYNPVIPSWVRTLNIGLYGLALLGTLSACWIPYFVGDPQKNHPESHEYFKKHHGFDPESPTGKLVLKPTPLRIITDIFALISLWLSLNI